MITVKRLAGLSGLGAMVGLLVLFPAAIGTALRLIRHEEPVRWVTLPWGMPSSLLIAVASHLMVPLVAGALLGILAGMVAAGVGRVLIGDGRHQRLHRAYWDAGLLLFVLSSIPLWLPLQAVVGRLAGGAGSPIALHGSMWPRVLPLAFALVLVAAATVVHLLSSRRAGEVEVAVGRWGVGTLFFSLALLGTGPFHGVLDRSGVTPAVLVVSLVLLLTLPQLLFLLLTTVWNRAAAGPLTALGTVAVRARIPGRFQHFSRLMLWIAPAALLLCLAATAIAGAARERGAPAVAEDSLRRPNLVLIYIDTLRRDHLSCYGQKRFTTPALDRLAAGAIQFQNATSPASHTVPAVCSVMTCRYPGQNGLGRGIPFQLSGDSLTLAGILRASGYRTAAFIGNYVLGRDYDTRIWQGFEVFDDRFPQRESERRIPEREAGALGRAAVSWLRAHQDQRFFLWLHFQDPHGPYMPPDGLAAESGLAEYGPLRSAPMADDNFSRGGIPVYQRLGDENDPRRYLAGYDGEIAHTDRHVGLVLAWLRNLGLYENTVVVLLSDHGEAMEDDHGYYFSHGHDLTEDQVRVPLLLRVPGASGGTVVSREVSTLDIYPTLLGLAGVELPQGLAGRDLLQVPAGGEGDQLVLTFTGGGIRAARWGSYKLIQRGGTAYLFNTDLDPGETTDLSEVEKGRALWLAREMTDELAAGLRAGSGGQAAGWSEDVRQRLRVLGYLD